jgi:hypothetical protein
MFEFVEVVDGPELSAAPEKVGKVMNGADKAHKNIVQASSMNTVKEPPSSAVRKNEYIK